MKNTKRVLRASTAEKILQILEDAYLEALDDYYFAEDSLRDDPGDWELDTKRINKACKKMERIKAVIDEVGGLNEDEVIKLRREWFG